MKATEKIVIHMIPELRWAHTHGLAELGHPELEIRNVPAFMLGMAGSLLNDVAQYFLDNPIGHVKVGEAMSVGKFCRFRFEQLPPIEPDQAVDYADERWCLVEVDNNGHCACCGEQTSSCGHGEGMN